MKLVVSGFFLLWQATGHVIFLHSKTGVEESRADKGLQGDVFKTESDSTEDADDSEDTTGSESVGEQDGGTADQDVGQDAEEQNEAIASESSSEEGEDDEDKQSADSQADEEVPQRVGESQSQDQMDHNIHVMCKFGSNHQSRKMLVDSGAALSMMSEPVAKQLGLWSQLDRDVTGQITGIGEAKVVGALHDIPVQVGDARLRLTFHVFSVQDDIVLLGVDELSRHKCVVDLDRNLLMVDGLHGISVPFLPYKRAEDDWGDDSYQASF